MLLAGTRLPEGKPARRGGRRRIGVGAGRAWWLWEWLGWWAEAIGRGVAYADIAYPNR